MVVTLGELAVRFGCELRGDPLREVDSVATLADAHPRAITFLAEGRYRAALAPFTDVEPSTYPGSAMLAMSVLGDDSSYLLCDIDPVSAADLREHAAGLSHCEVAERDGMAATAAWLGGDTVVHIDPFDPHAHVPGGAIPPGRLRGCRVGRVALECLGGGHDLVSLPVLA